MSSFYGGFDLKYLNHFPDLNLAPYLALAARKLLEKYLFTHTDILSQKWCHGLKTKLVMFPIPIKHIQSGISLKWINKPSQKYSNLVES